MIKHQQKLLEKLQKKADKEAERRRKQEARRRRREEEELRKKEGRKKTKRPKVSDHVTITPTPLSTAGFCQVIENVPHILSLPLRVTRSQRDSATLGLPWRWLPGMMACPCL